MKKITLMSLCLLIFAGHLLGGELRGNVTDRESGEVMPFATVSLLEGVKIIQSMATNLAGNFVFDRVPEEKAIKVRVDFIGYKSEIVELSKLSSNQIKVRMRPKVTEISFVEVVGYKKPLMGQSYCPYFDHDNVLNHYGRMHEPMEISKSPGKTTPSDIKTHSSEPPNPKLSIDLYPNPSSDFVTIKSNQPISEYILFDALGKQLKKGGINGKQTMVNVNELRTGNYFITAIGSDYRMTKKLQVVH